MKATHCSVDDLNKALSIVNEKYLGNIRFYELGSRGKATKFRLKTIDPKFPGTARSYSCKRTGSGCWHVHGDFFDALLKINPDAVVLTRISKITRFGGNWEYYDVGPKADPLDACDACDCNFSSSLIGRSNGTEADLIHVIKQMDADQIEQLFNSWGYRYGKFILTYCDGNILPLYADNKEYSSVVLKRLSKRRV